MHQAAEKAVRALHLARGQEAGGHVVARLLAELPVGVPQRLVERAHILDTCYVPARYPKGHPEGAPFEHYGPLQSSQGIEFAGDVLAFVRQALAAGDGGA